MTFLIFFFFNDTAPTEIYTLSLHDALPICAADWSSRSSTPTNRTPRGRHSCESAASAGASPRHGAHHDAQKFTTTTLPRRLARRSLPPPRAEPETSGAGWRAAGGQDVAPANWVPPARLLPWPPCAPCPPHAPSTSTVAAASGQRHAREPRGKPRTWGAPAMATSYKR